MVDSVYLHLIFEDSNETVTSLYAAKHSSIQSPKDAVEVLLKKQKRHSELKTMIKFFDHEITQEDLDTAARYGHFSQRPGDLFLKVNIHIDNAKNFIYDFLAILWCNSCTGT